MKKNLVRNSNENLIINPLWEELEGVTGDIGSDSDGVTSNLLLYETGFSYANTSSRSGVGDQNQITSSSWTGPSGCGPVNKHASALTTSPSWARIKSDMLTGPSLISMINQTYYGSHTVAGIGYIEFMYSGSSSGYEYMIVHDNWGTTPADVYVAYGRNYSTIYSVNFYPSK